MIDKKFINQSMLVSVGLGVAVIIATESELIKYEVQKASVMLEDFIADVPTEPGLYIWEGDLEVDLSGMQVSAANITWAGKFRDAGLADVFRFEMLRVRQTKAPDAVPTSEVPLLHLKCYHLAVMNMGVSPYDAVKNHSGHNSFELVDPEEGASAALQAWANDETADGGRTLRHLVIEDRSGQRRFIAQRRGQVSLYIPGTISFDAYTDYAGVLPNPGVVESMEAFERGAA